MKRERIFLDQGRWSLMRDNGAFIVTSDEELIAVARDPYNYKQRSFQKSFAEVCREVKESGGKIIGVSYDFFFGGKERRFYPPDIECIEAYKVLYNVAQSYGLLFTASIISPLDLGPPYAKRYSDVGYWFQYKEIKPQKDGSFETILPLQKTWFHNKGPCHLSLEGIFGYVYTEEEYNKDYFYVPAESIHPIEGYIEYKSIPNTEISYNSGYSKADLLIRGKVDKIEPDSSILLILKYKAEEMDYFSPNAEIFVKEVIDLYKNAGITLSGFYSDEMHIQFDWDLSAHFGKTEISIRYITPNLIEEFARRYGEEFKDFYKYLVYFAHHLEDTSENWPIQHIIQPNIDGIYDTVLFRKRYFTLLNEKVVHLYVKALNYAEKIFETTQYTQAHATWQESPTCDQYAQDYSFGKPLREGISRYDYGHTYVASSSIREAISACYDYFKWGEFLTGEGNDFPEGGNIDRNYYGMAMAVSFANINKFSTTYCGTWGSPKEMTKRFLNVASAYGVFNGLKNLVRYVQDFDVRTTPVLMLYPLDLLYANERFGSWMVQYGYGDYITEEMLLKHSLLTSDGRIAIYNKSYNTIVIFFQPIIREETLTLLSEFIRRGGKVVWMSIPPRVSNNKRKIFEKWANLFGIRKDSKIKEELHPNEEINFTGELEKVGKMMIPTSLFPDMVYFLEYAEEAKPIAMLRGKMVGSIKRVGNGLALYLGFRVRDNQSEKIFTLFNLLRAIGSYKENDVHDLSHSTPYIFTKFPNGAISVARHYYEVEENWSGEFFRQDDKENHYPPTWIDLEKQEIENHIITYKGDQCMSYRIDKDNNLIGFAGYSTTGITIDGREYKLIEKPGNILFAKIHPERILPDIKECWILYSSVSGKFILPQKFESADRIIVLDKTLTYTEKEITLEDTEYLTIEDWLKERYICIMKYK